MKGVLFVADVKHWVFVLADTSRLSVSVLYERIDPVAAVPAVGDVPEVPAVAEEPELSGIPAISLAVEC